MPLFYEKYEDKVDFYGEKAMAELKKHYAVFDAKVLSKIPRGPLKDKKREWWKMLCAFWMDEAISVMALDLDECVWWGTQYV